MKGENQQSSIINHQSNNHNIYDDDMNIPNDAQYWSPAESLTLTNGTSGEIEFQGLSAQPFAFNRINVGADDPDQLASIKATASLNQGRNVIFEDVQLKAIQRLFAMRSLKGGILIDWNKKLKLAIANGSGGTRTINADLVGYDYPYYQAKVQQYRDRGDEFPEPVFVYATVDIAANADQQRVTLKTPAEDLVLHRIAISSESDNDLTASFSIDNSSLIPERYISQINAQFENMDIIRPFDIPKNLPFEAFVSNADGASAHEISILCECYRV